MTMKKRMFIAAGLIGLPVITWVLLAWEPFDRLLARFFPEMFMGEFVRFVPYTPFDAFLATILLTVYAAVPLVVILLIYDAMVRSVRRRGAAGTAIRAGRIAYRGSVVILVAVWGMVLVIVHGIMVLLAGAGESAEHYSENAHGADDHDFQPRDRYGCYNGWDHRQHCHENQYSPTHRELFYHDE